MTTIAKDPTWEDMVILFATVPGFVANRNLYRGTWLIECLCYVFMNRACDMDLRDMLDEVAKRLRDYESEQGLKQSCSYESRHFYNKLYNFFDLAQVHCTPTGVLGPQILDCIH